MKIVIYEADVFAVFAQTFKADDQDASGKGTNKPTRLPA